MKPVQSAERKRLIQLIHIGKKQLGLDDGTYRQMLHTLTRKQSCSDLGVFDLRIVKTHLEKQGAHFTKRGHKTHRKGSQAAKMAVLWSQLATLGEANNDNDRALRHWVRSQTGERYEAPELCDMVTASRLIESLKRWIERVTQDNTGAQ